MLQLVLPVLGNDDDMLTNKIWTDDTILRKFVEDFHWFRDVVHDSCQISILESRD